MTRTVFIVPAHLSSKRFPRKVLAKVAGKTVLDWVLEEALYSFVGDTHPSVYLATPDEELGCPSLNKRPPLFALQNDSQVSSMLSDGLTAMDAVASVAQRLRLDRDDVVVNLQSDEPCLGEGEVDEVVDDLIMYGEEAAVLVRPVQRGRESDPNDVKAVVSESDRIVYTGRHPVSELRVGGVFAIRAGLLYRAYTRGSRSRLEDRESCDMNRLIDAGVYPRAVVMEAACPAIDVPEDIARAEAWLSDKSKARK